MKKVAQVFLLVTLIVAVHSSTSLRIVNGIPVDTTRRFPHHVNIVVSLKSYEGPSYRNCSGSIVSDQWILTSLLCIDNGKRYQLDFNRLHRIDARGSYSVVIDETNIIPYPTYYDDIALIRIPVKLQFSSNVKSVQLDAGETRYDNRLAVMPGFNKKMAMLTYGMFRVLPNSVCENVYEDAFDDYLQICSEGWNNNNQLPCEGNQGGGLIIGWPTAPKLIGVFSLPLFCNGETPPIFTRVSKYIQWISSIIGEWNEAETTTTDPWTTDDSTTGTNGTTDTTTESTDPATDTTTQSTTEATDTTTVNTTQSTTEDTTTDSTTESTTDATNSSTQSTTSTTDATTDTTTHSTTVTAEPTTVTTAHSTTEPTVATTDTTQATDSSTQSPTETTDGATDTTAHSTTETSDTTTQPASETAGTTMQDTPQSTTEIPATATSTTSDGDLSTSSENSSKSISSSSSSSTSEESNST